MELSKKALQIRPSSTLSISGKAKELMNSGIDVVSFGVGEPDFNTPTNINEEAIKAINEGFTKYTISSGTVELRKAICKKLKDDNNLNYEPSQIVVSNGAKHSLTNIFTAILNEGDEVIIIAPFWLSYPQIVNLAGGVSKIVYTDESNGFKITEQLLNEALTSKTKALIINSPSNPTGVVFSLEELQMVADFAVKNDILVISDEIYEKLIYDENKKHISIASLNEEIFNRTIVVNGLSKSYAMTGWRIGYTASSKEIASIMDNVQSHCASNPNSIAQKASVVALLGDQTSVVEMHKAFAQRRDYIYNRLLAMPNVTAVKPDGAFYLFVNVSKLCNKTIKGTLMKDAMDIADVLITYYNVAVIPCADFGFPNHIRLSYATSIETIEKGMDRIENFIKDI